MLFIEVPVPVCIKCKTERKQAYCKLTSWMDVSIFYLRKAKDLFKPPFEKSFL
jgi:hypothetical protein